ncbi:MAG: diacylglycerol kinase family protein [Chthoniobacteraceae bacterium]
MKRTGLARLVASFGYALRGLGILVATQVNARIHAVATVLAIVTGFWLGLTRLEWCAIIGAIGLVWTAEGLNTALEFLTDLVSPEQHPLAGKAKDVAAGAVLAASIAAAIIGVIIFGPKLWG